MAPPKFADLGKKAKDLFKKQYDYKNSMKVTHKSSPLTVETDVDIPLTSGQSKLTFKEKCFTVEAIVASKGNMGLTATLPKFVNGLELKVDVMKQQVNKTYKVDGVTVTGSANLKQVVEAAAVAELGSVNLGASAKLALGKDDVLADYNVGAEMIKNGVVLSVVTNNKLAGHTISWFQKCSSGLFGIDVNTCAKSGKRTLRIGGECVLSDDLTVRGKVDNNGAVSTAMTHVFSNPTLKATVATEFDIFADDIAPKKMGVALSFGDF